MDFEPIGSFRGAARRKYDAPRQGVFGGGRGVVRLAGGRNFETALRDLEGFERIWLVFAFDRNAGMWRPTTRPPVSAPGRERVGTFASRSPYRPNPIGISAVRLLSVRGLTLEVDEADLLDGTPILDIKPYVPSADAFPNACAGWVDEQSDAIWQVTASEGFAAASKRIVEAGGPDLVREATLQLSRDPLDSTRKRVESTTVGGTLALRMFRLDFSLADGNLVVLERVRSGYTSAELSSPTDPYDDKRFHRLLT